MDLPNFSGGNCAIDSGGHCTTFMMLPSLKKRALAGQSIIIKDLKQLVRLTKEGHIYPDLSLLVRCY